MFRLLEIGAPRLVTIAAVSLIGLALASSVAAGTDESWEFEHKLLGKPLERTADSNPSNDVSGIACAAASGFPRTCLLADDETQGAQIVILKDGKLEAGDFIRLIYNAYDKNLVELDAEGVAYADGYFYVVGSHGRPRHEDNDRGGKNNAKTEASRQIFRVGFDLGEVDNNGSLTGAAEIKPSTALSQFIKEQPELMSFFDRPLENNGLTIEGVAVRDKRLYVGMRGPLLEDGNAAILSVPLAALFDHQQGDAQLHRVYLERRGVRDLTAFDSGLLVLAGPVTDPPDDKIVDGDYAIYWWDGNHPPKLLHSLESFGKKVKPEAIVPLDRTDDKLRVLLFFDGPDKGAPRPVNIDEP
jgi:hypothetical protein